MAKVTINNGDRSATVRSGLNSNFTELYDGAHVLAASAKTTPVDADVVGIQDSAAGNGRKKVTWANIKATLKSYLDTLYAAIGHNHDAAYAAIAHVHPGPLARVLWIDNTLGDDGTGNGTMMKPYASLTPAIALAEANPSHVYTLMLNGYGADFIVTLNGVAWPVNIYRLIGVGSNTGLVINITGVHGDSGAPDGQSPPEVSLECHRMYIAVTSTGGSSFDVYGINGNGGLIAISGSAWRGQFTSQPGTVGTGGMKGDVALSHGIVEALVVANATLKFCNAIPCSFADTDAVIAGNCAFVSTSPAIFTDKGGNSTW